MQVEIYIETNTSIHSYERLDLFGDEDILLNLKLKDSRDIAKAYSTFSQAFTIPANSKNKKILNYFFNPDVFIANKSTLTRNLNAKIYVNKTLFKSGFITLNSTKLVNSNSSSIELTFYTGVSSLKELVGEDTISSLKRTYEILWDDFYVKGYLTYPHGVIVPFISNKRVWSFNDGGNDDIQWNTNTPTNRRFVCKEELRPAIPFSYIMDDILNEYNINVVSALFNREEYLKLFVHCTKETTIPMSDFIIPSTPAPTISGGLWRYTVTPDSDIFQASVVGPFASANTGTMIINFENLNIPLASDIPNEVTVDYIDQRVGSAGNSLFSEKISVPAGATSFTSTFHMGYSYFYGITVGNPLYYKVRVTTNQRMSWNARITFQTWNGAATFSTVSYPNPNNNFPYNLINMWDLIPDMKIIDLLDSFFKMFNIRVREDINNPNLMYWETPYDYNINGVEKDYTKYTNIEEVNIETQNMYKKYNFSHNTSKYKSNVDWKIANTSNDKSHEYGQLLYTNDSKIAKDEYSIKTKFNIVPPVLIGSSLIQTYYGFTSDEGKSVPSSPISNNTGIEYKPNYNEFTLYYHDGIQDLLWQPGDTVTVGFRVYGTAEQIYAVNSFNVADTFNVSTYSNSLGFNNEVNLTPEQFVCDKNLFSNNYSELISLINDPSVFLFKYKCFLPPLELVSFDLSNTIIIGERSFRIQEAQLNLTTGETNLTLLNIPIVKANIDMFMWLLEYNGPYGLFPYAVTIWQQYGLDTHFIFRTSNDNWETWSDVIVEYVGYPDAPYYMVYDVGSLPVGTQMKVVSISDGSESEIQTQPPFILAMWHIDSYSNPNLHFTKVYGTDTHVYLQLSTTAGATWEPQINLTVHPSPFNVGLLPAGTWVKMISTSNGTESNIYVV